MRGSLKEHRLINGFGSQSTRGLKRVPESDMGRDGIQRLGRVGVRLPESRRATEQFPDLEGESRDGQMANCLGWGSET